MSKQSLLAELRCYRGADVAECRSRDQTLSWLEQTEILTYPANKTGHLTADVWLLSPDYTRVLLTLHHHFHAWVQLGGHLDAGETIRQAALREAWEESGIEGIELLQPQIFDLDVHLVDAYPGEDHYHYDIRFLGRSPTLEYTVSPESDDLRWFTPDEVESLTVQDHWKSATLSRMTRKWRDFLAKM